MNISRRRPLQDGDIVNIDITAFKDGFHGDTSRTFLVGDVVSLATRICFCSARILTGTRMTKVGSSYK